ncbi:hypothetical protein D3C87_335670 [compost metagenome]
MSKQEYSKFLEDRAKKNFEKQSKYFDFDSTLFAEFRPLIYQINNSLIVESHVPALTATNYLVERLLKIALIYNEVKIESVELERLNSLYDLPNKKYIKLNFDKSIEKCRNLGLINNSERNFLDTKIRPLIRNSYSHGDPTKITNTLPKKTKAYVGSFSEPGKIDEIDFEKHFIPTFQSQLFNEFAEQNSKTYFDFAYNLISNIEDRINYFHKK